MRVAAGEVAVLVSRSRTFKTTSLLAEVGLINQPRGALPEGEGAAPGEERVFREVGVFRHVWEPEEDHEQAPVCVTARQFSAHNRARVNPTVGRTNTDMDSGNGRTIVESPLFVEERRPITAHSNHGVYWLGRLWRSTR